MNRWIAASLIAFGLSSAGSAQDKVIKIEIAGAHADAPLTIPLSVPKAWAKFDEVAVDVITGRDVAKITGQLTAAGIATESIKPAKDGLVRRDLHVVITTRCLGLVVHFEKTPMQIPRFAWLGKKGDIQELNLTYSGRAKPVLRYMNHPYDASTPEARNKSYKVFHHLYDPEGRRLVTNGGFADDNIGDPKKLLYPHHRGIMYGFNKCSYGPNLKFKADTWHCTGEARVVHEKTLSAETGPVLGRHRVQLGWNGESKARFLAEERELTVYNVKGGTLVDFASRLTTTLPGFPDKVRIDGDPQHAGFQFRAHNDVAAKSKGQTYYLHPDGSKGELGKERNWPGDKTMVDLPWYAMSFVLDGQRYTAVYLNHPSNPKETRFSERDYGRFGGYFQRDITEDAPLVVNYRLWLQSGEVTLEQAQALHKAFATPARTAVK